MDFLNIFQYEGSPPKTNSTQQRGPKRDESSKWWGSVTEISGLIQKMISAWEKWKRPQPLQPVSTNAVSWAFDKNEGVCSKFCSLIRTKNITIWCYQISSESCAGNSCKIKLWRPSSKLLEISRWQQQNIKSSMRHFLKAGPCVIA